LSKEGFEEARRVGETMRGREFTHLVLTPYFLTAQTAAAFSEGAGDFTIRDVMIEPSLLGDDDRVRGWFEATAAARAEFGEENDGVEFVKRVRPDFFRFEFLRLQAVMMVFLNRLPEGCNALVVGHSPQTDCAIYGFSGRVIGRLRECEGVALTLRDGIASFDLKEIRL
jgi:hypothetical protein